MAGLIALTVWTATWLSVVLLVVGAVALTVGEMLESPSWWTISYELAPPARKDEYLAAFDLCYGLMGIVGPMAMALVVAGGALGWAGYAAVLIVALVAAGRLAPHRDAEEATAQSVPV
jgi:MFS family permease